MSASSAVVRQTPAPVYLTFDDGPDRDWTPRILDLLGRVEVQATFFMIGERAQREPELVRRIAAAGHAIGNHTFSHRHPWTMSASSARAQVRDGAKAIADILGRPARLYRAPHGRYRACMRNEAELCGQKSVHWDLSAIDWGPLGTAERIAARLQRTQAGNVVLMHDGRNEHNRPDELLKVLPDFIEQLMRMQLHPARIEH